MTKLPVAWNTFCSHGHSRDEKKTLWTWKGWLERAEDDTTQIFTLVETKPNVLVRVKPTALPNLLLADFFGSGCPQLRLARLPLASAPHLQPFRDACELPHLPPINSPLFHSGFLTLQGRLMPPSGSSLSPGLPFSFQLPLNASPPGRTQGNSELFVQRRTHCHTASFYYQNQKHTVTLRSRASPSASPLEVRGISWIYPLSQPGTHPQRMPVLLPHPEYSMGHQELVIPAPGYNNDWQHTLHSPSSKFTQILMTSPPKPHRLPVSFHQKPCSVHSPKPPSYLCF